MWYDRAVVQILFLIAKIYSRHGDKTYAHEIEELIKNIKEEKENK